MTFKHTKFDESSVMRSFEKTARNKGLIEEDVMVHGLIKQAKSKIDLKPSEDFTLNIVKLCEGLRSKGFNKYANEIENKFMTYKRAETLYDIHKETGEDVVDQAHPDGSHKLEGVDGDSTFETILDQHEMIKKVVEKNPTGKLSNNKDILKAVKVALGQNNPPATKASIELYKIKQNFIATTTSLILYANQTLPHLPNQNSPGDWIPFMIGDEEKYEAFMAALQNLKTASTSADSYFSDIDTAKKSVKNAEYSAKSLLYSTPNHIKFKDQRNAFSTGIGFYQQQWQSLDNISVTDINTPNETPAAPGVQEDKVKLKSLVDGALQSVRAKATKEHSDLQEHKDYLKTNNPTGLQKAQEFVNFIVQLRDNLQNISAALLVPENTIDKIFAGRGIFSKVTSVDAFNMVMVEVNAYIKKYDAYWASKG